MDKNREKTTAFMRGLRQLAPAFMVMFTFCFMLFLYEPLLMYSTNKNEFWFDFGIMILPTLAIFAMFFFAGIAFITLFYCCVTKILGGGKTGEKIYYCAVIAFFVLFLATYIQGVFLTGSLPPLIGKEIEWDIYWKEDILTVFLWMLLEAAAIGMTVRFGTKRMVGWAWKISAAVVVMLVAGLLPQMIENDAFASKNSLVVTKRHFNDISTDKNFFILLVDAANADEFTNLLAENENYKEIFRDFTFYDNTASVYPCTRDSIPLILSGAVNRNEKAFEEYSSDAYNCSPFFEKLESENYSIGLYMEDPIWYGERCFNVVNDVNYVNESPYESMNFYMYFRQQMKYILFKYLPYAYKQYAQIEGMDYHRVLEQYHYDNEDVYKMICDTSTLEQVDHNVFQFIHLEGAHGPFKTDAELNPIEHGTYTQKMEATVKVVDAYLRRLKENHVYDNSVIMIMADHGYYDVEHIISGEEYLERYHPILLVKGLGEEHEFDTSSLPISHLDIVDACLNLLDGQTGIEAFDFVDSDRKRMILWYEFLKEDHMVEYELEGNRFEREDFKKTGRVYDR